MLSAQYIYWEWMAWNLSEKRLNWAENDSHKPRTVLTRYLPNTSLFSHNTIYWHDLTNSGTPSKLPLQSLIHPASYIANLTNSGAPRYSTRDDLAEHSSSSSSRWGWGSFVRERVGRVSQRLARLDRLGTKTQFNPMGNITHSQGVCPRDKIDQIIIETHPCYVSREWLGTAVLDHTWVKRQDTNVSDKVIGTMIFTHGECQSCINLT